MADLKSTRLAVFSTKKYDKLYLEPEFEQLEVKVKFYQTRLAEETLQLALGFDALCIFVNDEIFGESMVKSLAESGVKYILLRCAGFNNVDIKLTEKYGLKVARVPAYSPYAVAEFAIALMLMMNRKVHKAYNRVRMGNFSLEGLTGFDMHSRTIGIVGTGKIGLITGKICHGFGSKVICYDPYPRPELAKENGMSYVDSLDELFAAADIISLHCPLTADTHHLINKESIKKMKHGAMIVNTSRGGLIDTVALIHGLKSGRVGNIGMDVYENEQGLYFEDTSDDVIQDDLFGRLLSFPNVCITGHQAFLTTEALKNIASQTAQNLIDLVETQTCSAMVNAD